MKKKSTALKRLFFTFAELGVLVNCAQNMGEGSMTVKIKLFVSVVNLLVFSMYSSHCTIQSTLFEIAV